MSRDFPKPVKRLALERAQKRCEAIGGLYGLPAGHRCNADLSYGVEFDHVVLHANSHDSSLENCAAVCIKCHKHKSTTHDTPLAAKTLRQQDKANGIKKRGSFPKPPQGSRWDWRLGRRVIEKEAT